MTTSDAPKNDTPAKPRRAWLLWMVAGIAYAIDLGSKLAVVAGLEGHAPVPVIGTWMELRGAPRRGAPRMLSAEPKKACEANAWTIARLVEWNWRASGWLV